MITHVLIVVAIFLSLGWLCFWTIKRNTWAGVVLTIAIIGLLAITGSMRS